MSGMIERSESVDGLAVLQKMAEDLAESGLVPKAYERKPACCLIAMNVARRLNCEPLTVMQNLDIIHGRPTWRATFLVATFNGCGKFTSIKYRFEGAPGTDDWRCVAYCTEAATGEVIEGPPVSWRMAKAEGWVGKSGSKWQTMPELMFRYRAAAFLVRTTAPELAMGFHTDDEAEDMRAAQAQRVQVETLADLAPQPEAAAAPAPRDGWQRDKVASGVAALKARIAAARTRAELDAVTADPAVVKQRQWLGKNQAQVAESITQEIATRAIALAEATPNTFDGAEFLKDLAACKTAAEVDAVEARWSASLPEGDARLAEVAGECEQARAKIAGGK